MVIEESIPVPVEFVKRFIAAVVVFRCGWNHPPQNICFQGNTFLPHQRNKLATNSGLTTPTGSSDDEQRELKKWLSVMTRNEG